MGDIICNDHPLHLLQINSLVCHQNPTKDHNNGVITVCPILRLISIMGMIEIITDMIACIRGMMDDLTSVIEDITTRTEDIGLMRELLGGRCTMMLAGEDFLLFHQVLFFLSFGHITSWRTLQRCQLMNPGLSLLS
jgi:hypothetical protein